MAGMLARTRSQALTPILGRRQDVDDGMMQMVTPDVTPKAGKSTSRDWFNVSQSPGPQAYSPNTDTIKQAPGRTVFGTSKRENEERRYIASQFVAAAHDVPGPGQYRLHVSDSNPNGIDSPSSPGFLFGSSQQRPDDVGLWAPGATYTLPDPRSSVGASFAVHGSVPDMLHLGGTGPPGGAKCTAIGRPVPYLDPTPGPLHYTIGPPESVSPVARAPAYSFSRTTRGMTKGSVFSAQLDADHTCGTAADTPGHIYDPYRPGKDSGVASLRFGTSAQRYSPERGRNLGGPVVSKQHAEAGLGCDSPGPASYDITIPRCKSSACFGSPKDGLPAIAKAVQGVPGPGTYTPHCETLAGVPHAPSYSLGPALRYGSAMGVLRNDGPGCAAYTLPPPDRASQKQRAPAYSLGALPVSGRAVGEPADRSTEPGPNTYTRRDGELDLSGRRGFSFGMKERTVHALSMATVRCHGPLASQESVGMSSPGPAQYVVSGCSRASDASPSLKFDQALRSTSAKLYFSSLHAAAEGCGLDSPGPGTYTVADSPASSRYRSNSPGKWGTSERFRTSAVSY
ncbi:MAG: hypothetical protein WDW36_008706 [Sanguina aurantia]